MRSVWLSAHTVWAESKHSWATYLQIMKSVFVHLLSGFGGDMKALISLTMKFGLEALDFNYCALDFQQSGFLWCFQYLMCTIPIIPLSHNAVTWFCQDMQSLGVNQRFLFGLKVVLISVAAALSAPWLTRKPNPTYCTSQDKSRISETLSFKLMKIHLLSARLRLHEFAKLGLVSLHTMMRRDVGCCLWWSLMP